MLTDAKVRALKPRATLYRIADEKGLSIEVRPNGKRYWRFRYRFAGRAKMLSLGAYPDVGLKKARSRRDHARSLLEEGLDPSGVRRTEQAATCEAQANSFAQVARDWMRWQDVSPKTKEKNEWLLERIAIPQIGALPIKEVTPRIMLDMLRKIEGSGRLETAQRLKMKCGQVFRWAIIEGRAEYDPTTSLRGALKRPEVRHHATITDPRQIGPLLRAIWEYQGQATTRAALKLAPITFVRVGNLRKALWSEFDLDAAEWRIPAERMKMKTMHLVPLSKQAIEIIRELRPLTGDGNFLFPSIRTTSRPISENTLNAALRYMGYTKADINSYGFRAMASSRLNEMSRWNRDAIERQLDHAERNKVRAAYIHAAEYLQERREMMQVWADYLDTLRLGASSLAR